MVIQTKQKLKNSSRPFSVETLARRGVWDAGNKFPHFSGDRRYFDHITYYRQGRKAAAIVAQLYNVPDDIHVMAAQHGLFANVDPFPANHHPNCTVVIYTPIKPKGLKPNTNHKPTDQ